MDEVPIPFDMPANRTIKQVGANSVPIMTTGNENIMYCCFSMFFKWIQVLQVATNGNFDFFDFLTELR